MLAFITTEFQKLKRYSIILVGMLGVACSPIISIVMQKIMTDEAKNVLNYTFPDLLNSTIWNNMTMFFPMIIALIGGYMINREYTDDTLKNLQVIPISFPKLMIGKLTTIGLLSILLGLCNSFVTIIVGIIACRENMTLSTIIIGTIQICGMALFTFIGEMPLIAHCGKKQNSFKGGADYDDFSGNEIIFGGTALERDNGNKIEISCDIAAQTGNLKLILQTGTDEPKILCDTESSYNDTIELPSASNYVLIEADNFTGSLKLKLK